MHLSSENKINIKIGVLTHFTSPIPAGGNGECNRQPVREAVSYRGLFTAGWFGVREKHCSRLEIYDRLRASEQAESNFLYLITTHNKLIQIHGMCFYHIPVEGNGECNRVISRT